MDSMMMDSDNSNTHYFHHSTHQPFQNNYQYQYQSSYQNQVQAPKVTDDDDDDLWEPIYTHPSFFHRPNNSNRTDCCNSVLKDSDWVEGEEEEERNNVELTGATAQKPQTPFTFGQNQPHSGFFTNWSTGQSELELDFFTEVEPDCRDPSRSYIRPVRGQHKTHKTIINRASSDSQEEPQQLYLGYKMENGRLYRKRDNKGSVKNGWDDWASDEQQEIQADENILRNPKASRLEW